MPDIHHPNDLLEEAHSLLEDLQYASAPDLAVQQATALALVAIGVHLGSIQTTLDRIADRA